MKFRATAIILLLLLISLSGFSQNKELLRKQFSLAQASKNYLEGYNKNLGGNNFIYHSLRNDVTEAIITRCSNGKQSIEWETAAIPSDYNKEIVSFVWLAAIDLTEKNNKFDVFIDDIKRFEIISDTAKSWKITHADGAKLEFITFSKDQHGDAHGYMSLTAPKKWIKLGKPLKIRIVGENKQENTWIIIYKAQDVVSYLYRASLSEIWMNITCTKKDDRYNFIIEAPAHMAEKTINSKFGGIQNTLIFSKYNKISRASFSVLKPANLHLIIRDQENRIVDISDISKESSKQIMLSHSILENDVKIENGYVQIDAQRIYCPNTITSMLELENSNLGNGTIYIMNSSHQDIAWMDSPEKCILERDTMLITPLLESALKNPEYRFDIEDALMIKEYIERHPEKEAIIKQLLLDGKISCGATYIQPYEEMYSGEALARQFYFGKKWLKDRFGYNANTYWNVDVPGRTPQMPQIMKKAGVNYLMISRHERSVFNWLSPDGSSVLTFSPGHYTDAFAALNKSFYESAEYVASSSMDWAKYFTEDAQNVTIPILSDWDMSPAKDYSKLINKWGDINQIETEAGKELSVNLPDIKISTAPEFMKDFENSALNIPSIQGERPAVWTYIHGPSHQKAIKASREGDILLTVAEKFATIDALVKESFEAYPQQRLTNAWEAKIYPDHGWGGKQGHITDNLFRRKFEFARSEAKQIIDNSIQSIAAHVNTNAKKGIPIVVFNSLNWNRNNPVSCVVKFRKGETKNFILYDANKKIIAHQKETVDYYKDGSIKSAEICFIAPDVPSLGYSTFYVKPAKSISETKNNTASTAFENSFYKIAFSNGGLSSIYDKDLGVELLNTEKFKAGEVFTMKSEGHGAGEFDNIQQPSMQDFDKTSNYENRWELVSEGPVFATFTTEQKIRNATVLLSVKIYNSIKKIDFDIALLNWEGVLYREYRMALPLNMINGKVAYEVPYGVSEVGLSEINGAAGERYQTPAVDIHPRAIENWIGANNKQFGVTLSSTVVAVDYIDPTNKPTDYTMLQPILLASRRSCHHEGNEYLQTGNHYFSFSLSSHQAGWENGYRFGKEANEKLFSVVKPQQFKNAELAESTSFFKLSAKNTIVSAIKKSEDEDAVVIRMYDILGKESKSNLELNFKVKKAYHTSLIEEELKEQKHLGHLIPISIGKNAIETFKIYSAEKE